MHEEVQTQTWREEDFLRNFIVDDNIKMDEEDMGSEGVDWIHWLILWQRLGSYERV